MIDTEKEDRLREIIREELKPMVTDAVTGAVNDAIKDFTTDFYAEVGKGVVKKALFTIGMIAVYFAWKFGLLPFMNQPK
jgi:hypothetical protein